MTNESISEHSLPDSLFIMSFDLNGNWRSVLLNEAMENGSFIAATNNVAFKAINNTVLLYFKKDIFIVQIQFAFKNL